MRNVVLVVIWVFLCIECVDTCINGGSGHFAGGRTAGTERLSLEGSSKCSAPA